MPITVTVTTNITCYEIHSPWSLQEFYEVVDQGYQQTINIMPLFIIYDLRRSHEFPRNFLSAMQYMEQYKQNNAVLRLVVEAPLVATVLYKILKKVRPALTENFVFVHTLDEAYGIISGYAIEPYE